MVYARRLRYSEPRNKYITKYSGRYMSTMRHEGEVILRVTKSRLVLMNFAHTN